MSSISPLVLLILLGFVRAEPDYCKRGVRISEAYQHCFESARMDNPYGPLRQPKEIIDGCFVEAYANHTCSIVKTAALECFREEVQSCAHRERLFAIADESGGACFGNHINRIFKEHVLNFLEPVRADSQCFVLGDRAYECYIQAGQDLVEHNPDLDVLSVDQYMDIADQFFDSILNCFIKIYRSNLSLCENWQIPLLLEIQATALPSLFGLTFTAEQMDKLELHNGCPAEHLPGVPPYWRDCQGEEEEESGRRKGPPSPNKKNKQRQRQRMRQHLRQQQQQRKKLRKPERKLQRQRTKQRQRERQRQEKKERKQQQQKQQQAKQQKQQKQQKQGQQKQQQKAQNVKPSPTLLSEVLELEREKNLK